MALTELRAAQVLAKRFYGKVPLDEINNLAALCGYIDLSETLRVAFNKGTGRREVRDIDPLARIVRDALDDASITEPTAQQVAGEAVLRVLSQVFNLNVATHTSFRDLRKQVVTRAQGLTGATVRASTAASLSASLTRLGATVRSTGALHETPVTSIVGKEAQPSQTVQEVVSKAPSSDLSSLSHSLARLQSELILARAAPALEAATAAFKQCELARNLWAESPSDRDLNENLRSALESVREVADRAKDVLPGGDELTTQQREREEVAEILGVGDELPLSPDAYQLLRDQRDWPSIVKSSALMKALDSLNLPTWIWPNSLPDDLRQSAIGRLVGLRRDAVLGDDLARCVEWCAQYQRDADGLRSLTEPPQVGTLVQRLEHSWTRAEQLRAAQAALEMRVATLRDTYPSDVLASMLSTDEPELVIARAEGYRSRYLDIATNVHSEVRQELLSLVIKLDLAVVDAFDAIRVVLDRFGQTVLQGIAAMSAIRALADTQVARVTEPPTLPRTVTNRMMDNVLVSVAHPLSRQTGNSTNVYQARVCYRRRGDAQYGILTVPVRIRFDHPVAQSRELKLSVESDMLVGQPKDWQEVVEPRHISIPAHVTRVDFAVSIPLTRERASQLSTRTRTLTLRFRLYGDGIQMENDTLTWRDVALELPQFPSPFAGSMQLDLMEQRPLGVEKHFQAILQMIRQGERSFIVRAPRRYGKTWLLQGLIKKAQPIKEVLVMKEVVASSRDLAGVWGQLAESLERELKRPVPRELEDGVILREDAFDQVREEAHRRGIRTIYLLIDEAQSFFAQLQSRRLSERLKERLEGGWGSRDNDRAAIRMGFVGQAHLTKLMGGNLLGAIPAQYDNKPIDEEDLLGLLRDEAAEGLQSSSEARRRLVELAGNLWILDKLLDGVIQRCTEKSRPWFLDSDVDAAAEVLVDGYRRKDDALWRYVRDVLNESDDLDRWAPSETFPIAMGLARAREDHVGTNELPQRVEEILHSWARDLEILPDRITQGLERLRDANIINREFKFEIPMLERLLAVRARQEDPFEGEAEKEALDRLGLSRIRRPQPPDTDLGEGGGQATIYRAVSDGQDVAVRTIRLAGQTDRRRFMSELSALGRLGEVNGTSTSDWSDVYSHLPRVLRGGIADDDPGLGVVMYQWIHGHHLRERSLSQDAALAVGTALGMVLALLEELEIVHRDVNPKNIILRAQRWSPVLIDFGLARAVVDLASSPDTIVGTPEFIPPEVIAGGSQKWSTSGDVFALGQTLQRCLVTSASLPTFNRLTASMSSSSPTARPSAKTVYDEFRSLEESSKIEARHKQLELRVVDALGKLPDPLRSIADRAKGDTVVCLSGLVSDAEQRCALVAEFLENAFSKYVSVHRSLREAFEREQGTKLRWVQKALERVNDRTLRPLASSPAVAVAHLRNANAHSTEFDKHVLQAYGVLRTTRTAPDSYRALQNAVVETAGRIGSLFEARDGLSKYVRFWLQVSG